MQANTRKDILRSLGLKSLKTRILFIILIPFMFSIAHSIHTIYTVKTAFKHEINQQLHNKYNSIISIVDNNFKNSKTQLDVILESLKIKQFGIYTSNLDKKLFTYSSGKEFNDFDKSILSIKDKVKNLKPTQFNVGMFLTNFEHISDYRITFNLFSLKSFKDPVVIFFVDDNSIDYNANNVIDTDILIYFNILIRVLLVFIIIYYINKEAIKPIEEINDVIKLRSDGIKTVHASFSCNNEILSLSNSLNILLDKIDRSEFLNSKVIDNTANAIFFCNEKFQIIKFNNYAIKLFGVDKNFINKNIFDFIKLDDPDPRNFIKHKLEKTVKCVAYDILGNSKTIDLFVSEVGGYDEKFYIIFIYDITANIQEIHELELINKDLEIAKNKAKQADKAKSEFLANMSHEIRTPINGIMGCVGLLEEKVNDPVGKDYIKLIKNSSEDLLVIINDILDFSKIEAGMLTLENIPFDIIEAIKNTHDLMKFKAAQKSVDLLFKVDPSVQQYLVGDVSRIKQIVLNLVSNSIKFTHQGYVLINISQGVSVLDSKFAHLKISVKDTGVGIKPENMDKIFEKFTQEDLSTTRKYGGTGLGLSISKKLATMLGGDLTVESEYGFGSTFTLEVNLPIASEKDVEELKSKENKDTKLFTHIKGHVLVVEDNSVNQIVITKILESFGITSVIANNGLEALKVLEDGNKFDLILMDCQMPEMDGFTATRHIRNNPELEKNIIIAVTAKATQDDLNECLKAGMNDFISKPIAKNQLYNTLVQYLPRK